MSPLIAAFAPSSWLVWLLLVAACCSALRARFSWAALLGCLLAGGLGPLILAAAFSDQAAAASVLRWSMALYALAVSAALWLRERLPTLGVAFPAEAARWTRLFTLSWTALVVVGLTLAAVAQSAWGGGLGGPAAGSFWGSLPPLVLYGGPLLILAATMWGHAWRERSAWCAVGASLLWQLTVWLACLLYGAANRPELAAEMLQWSAAALGAHSLLWLSMRHRVEPSAETAYFLQGQIYCAVAAIAGLAFWAAAGVILRPQTVSAAEGPLGGWVSYLGWSLTVAAAAWWSRNEGGAAKMWGGGGFALALAALIAATADSWEPLGQRQWLAYHVLLAGAAISALALTSLAWRRDDRQAALTTIVLVGLLAWRGVFEDPQTPWWSAATTAAMFVAAAVIAWRKTNQHAAYLSTAMAVSATWFVWSEFLQSPSAALLWIAATSWTLSVCGGLWLAAEVLRQRREEEEAAGFQIVSVLSWTALGLYGISFSAVVFLNALGRWGSGREFVAVPPWTTAAATLAVGLLLAGRYWDRRAQGVVPAWHLWGLATLLLTLDAFSWGGELVPATCLATAGYTALTGWLWRRCLRRAGKQSEAVLAVGRWLAAMNLLLAYAAALAILRHHV